MLINVTAVERWRVRASDGEAGRIVDLLVDARSWTVRGLVVETGHWGSSHRVLLAPDVVHREHGEFGFLRAALTRAQVRTAAPADGVEARSLRSCRTLIGYKVEASDGEAGQLHDLALDDERWAIAGLVVDTGRWWIGDRLLVPPSAVREIRDADRHVCLALARADLPALARAEAANA